METAAATRSCGRQKTAATRRRSGSASSTRTAAPRPHPERSAAGGHMPVGGAFDDVRLAMAKGTHMDTVTAISERRLEAVPMPSTPVVPGATKTLTVTATYLLS